MKSAVRPKKFLGQHFLTDMSVARRIADTVDTCPDLPILEVGPGTGVLTQFLMTKERPIKVVEIDRESVPYLKTHFPSLADAVIEADFLGMDLAQLWNNRPFVLTGNYPYNISSQIFFKMLGNRELIPCCTGMIQKEVAERLAARPGGKTYGVLTVFVQLWYDVEYLFTVDEHVFNPPPKVKSAVVRLSRNQRTELPCEERVLRHIVKTVFTMRRKMLRNGMRQIVGSNSRLLELPIMTRRPEDVSIDEYIDLAIQVQAEQQAIGH